MQNLIERCLQLYMSEREAVFTLQARARVDPAFTALVWAKLEEQNGAFFRAYYTRLKLKDQVGARAGAGGVGGAPAPFARPLSSPPSQIVLFNHLLEQQVSMSARVQDGTAWDGSGAAGRDPLDDDGAGPPLDAPPAATDGVPPFVGLPRPSSAASLGELAAALGEAPPTRVGSGGLSGGGRAALGGLPRNFSLSDLTFEGADGGAGDAGGSVG